MYHITYLLNEESNLLLCLCHIIKLTIYTLAYSPTLTQIIK